MWSRPLTDLEVKYFQWQSTLGSAASLWWPTWSALIEALNGMTNIRTKVKFVLSLPSDSYTICNGTGMDVCLDDSLFNDSFTDQVDIFKLHYIEKLDRF